MKEILTVKEVAEYLSLSRITIYNMIRKREIPAIRVGGSWRFRIDLLKEWFENKSTHTGKSKCCNADIYTVGYDNSSLSHSFCIECNQPVEVGRTFKVKKKGGKRKC